jgi:hypothetical protein
MLRDGPNLLHDLAQEPAAEQAGDDERLKGH